MPIRTLCTAYSARKFQFAVHFKKLLILELTLWAKKRSKIFSKNPYLCSWSWHWQINKGLMFLILILVNKMIYPRVANCGRQVRCLFHFLATPPGGRGWIGGVRYLWGSYRAWHEGWVLLHSPWCCVGLKYILRLLLLRYDRVKKTFPLEYSIPLNNHR